MSSPTELAERSRASTRIRRPRSRTRAREHLDAIEKCPRREAAGSSASLDELKEIDGLTTAMLVASSARTT